MAKKIEELFDDFTEDFLSEKTSRIIIIVGSSKIDELLANILRNSLLPKLAKNNDQDELLEGDSPISTLSSRIKMTYRLGIIDVSFYNVLDKIRKIRNIGAHQLSFNINTSPLKEHVLDLFKLLDKRKSFELTQKRFFIDGFAAPIEKLKCSLLSVCVLLQVITEKVDKPNIRQSLNRITAN